jgi:hypothetical protein
VSPLPAPRKIPVVPRPRHGELSGSYLARVAQANRIGFRSFLCLLGAVPSAVASNNRPDLAVMVLTLNDSAFSRLLAYTGLDAVNLIKAVPSLAPRSQAQGEPPAIRLSFLKSPVADCPGCRVRRGGAYADTHVLRHKAACLRHGYWLYGQAQRISLADLPEVAAAQRRLERIAARRGPGAVMRKFELATWYLEHAWRIDHHPHWYADLLERWQGRVRAAGATAASTTWQMPSWATHPERVALTAVFTSPYWAAQAVPRADRQHRLFYEHLAAELGISDGRPLQTVRAFDPLPADIHAQAEWGRVLSDPDWNTLPPPGADRLWVLNLDITDGHAKCFPGYFLAAG